MPRNRETFDRPHEGTVSSSPPDLVGKSMYLNDCLDRLMMELDAIERGLVGSPPAVVAKGDPRVGQTEAAPPAGFDGLQYQLDLAITRATACLGAADSLARPFRRSDNRDGEGQRNR